MDKTIIKFAEQMQYKLDKNRHKECSEMNSDKKGRKWTKCSTEWLLSRLKEEVIELEEALKREKDIDIKNEAADVGNFAMMIHNNISLKSNG